MPVANRLAEEGKGFNYLSANLAQERLSIAVAGVAAARAALGWTLVRRRAHGVRQVDRDVPKHPKFVLAEVATEIDVTQAYVDQCIMALNAGELTPAQAAQAKYWCTDLQNRATDRCLQLFGGYGYMTEYPIARAYVDARVTSIYGGTNEVMKTIIAKSLGL